MDATGILAEIILFATVVVLVYLGILLICAIISYILSGIALQTIAKRREIPNPWLAWVPYGNIWLSGKIADDYQQKIHGKNTNKAMFMLVGFIVVEVVNSIGGFASTWTDLTVPTENEWYELVVFIVAVLILLVQCGVTIAYNIYSGFVYYDIFRSCNPKRSLLYTLLGLFLGLTPLFLLLVRKQDLGMVNAPVTTEEEVL